MENLQRTDLKIKFDGPGLVSGSIDLFDLAHTILAFGQVVEKIADNENITRNHQIKVDVNALKQGSFDILLSIAVEHTQSLITQPIPTLLFASAAVNQAGKILDIFKSVIKIKNFLAGEAPSDVVIKQDGSNNVAVIYNFKGDNMQVTLPVYNALQDKRINEGIKKMAESLKKEGGEVEEIIVNGLNDVPGEAAVILKKNIQYYDRTEELQTVASYKVKGNVTAFDRKTFNGKLSINDQKRVSFEIDTRISDIDELNRMVEKVIESLKLKLNVIIQGEAVLDFESNLKKIIVQNIIIEARLLE